MPDDSTPADAPASADQTKELPPGTRQVSRQPAWKRIVTVVAALLIVWLLAAYILIPLGWRRYVHRHPAFDDIPNITHTKTGIPGDPLNVAIVGTEKQLKSIMITAKWYPADPLTLKSCLEIAEATVLKRPYDEAPVSNLYWEGRKEDLAFEMPVGPDPRKRHHVRFWRTKKVDEDGRPIWIGSATFDSRVGLSHTTAEITHHIAANVDAERDHLLDSLQETGDLAKKYYIDDFHKVREGKNGGGDRWYTDGKLGVGVINRND